MDSAIRLSYTTLLSAAPPPRRSSGTTATLSPSRVHLSLSHVASLCLSQYCSKRHRMISRPLHVNCMLDRFSSEGSKNEIKEEDYDKKIVMRGVSLVLACVLGAFTLSSKINPKSHIAYACWLWSTSDHLAETQHLVRPKFQRAPSPAEVKDLKLYAISVSSKNSRQQAVKILEEEYEKWKKEFEPRHFLEMALIELLLMQGKYRDASGRIDSRIDELLEEEDPRKLSDQKKVDLLLDSMNTLCTPEIFVYKALVDMALNKKDNATTWLNGFVKKKSQTSPQSPQSVMPKRF